MQSLAGKIVVITGAGSGIGRAIALALGEAGSHVVVSDVCLESAQRVCGEVTEFGVRSRAIRTDVAERDSVMALADETYRTFGRVDILCNNAGVIWRPMRTVDQATQADWKWMFDVNFWGVVNGIDIFVPRMRGQAGEKHIVNTSSFGGLIPLAGYAPYCASKAAVTALSEAVALELAPQGFGVTILHPGFVRTGIGNSEALRPSDEQSVNRDLPIFNNATLGALAAQTIEPGLVGRMVKNAIEQNQLYVHTHPVSRETVLQRMELMFGSNTVGRI